MNTTVIQNSLKKDQSVNPQQTQFTNDEATQNPATSLLSHSDKQSSSKKDEKSTNMKLSTSDEHVYYGEAEAIKGIDLIIYENEGIAFIGPSGCGNSTFL